MPDWMEQLPDPVPGDYRKRPEPWRLWQPRATMGRHKTDKRGRGVVGRVFEKRRGKRA